MGKKIVDSFKLSDDVSIIEISVP